DGKLMATLRMAEHGTSTWIDTLTSLLKQRILRACSVGFRALKMEPLEGSKWGIRFIEQELLEISLVTVPANAAAIATARSFGLPAQDMARLFADSGRSPAAPVSRSGSPASPPPSTTRSNSPKGNSNMKIGERIAALESGLLSKRDALVTLTNKEDLDEQD